METRPLQGSQVRLSVIGQGTWQISTGGQAAEQALDALALGAELGMSHIDTAEMYGSGDAEELIGRLLRERRVPRDSLVLASKVLPHNASYRGTLAACDKSLRRLGTDYLDLYMLHWPGAHPIAETLRALEALVEAGKVRALGLSNFNVEDLEAARLALGRHPISFNQVLYHLKERSIERRLLPYCARHGILVVAYSPFGNGDFPSPSSELSRRVLHGIGQRHGKTARQVALRFLTHDSNVVAIPKAEDLDHVRDNAGACGWQLDAEERAELDEAFPVHGDGLELPMI